MSAAACCALAGVPLVRTANAQPAPSAAAPSTEADRGLLDPVLKRMTDAVLAADGDAYLAGVDRSDPMFAKEQENWVKDLKRKPVKEFKIEIEKPGLAGPDGPMSGELSMVWRLADEGAPERRVRYAAKFVRDAERGWLYAGEDWQKIEVNGVRVLFSPGQEPTARTISEILPDIRTHVHEGFEVAIDRTQEVKLYSNMRHLQQSIYLGYTDGLSGWNEPGESIKLLAGRRSSADELKPLLAHEYGHVATFEYGPHANDMPWWILEGVAELSAERFGGAGTSMVAAWAKSGQLLAWNRLADFHLVKPTEQGHVYVQGHHMLGYVSERFGRAGRNAWLRAMAQGASLEDATKSALGVTFAELDGAWRASIGD